MIYLPRYVAAITSLAARHRGRYALTCVRVRELVDGRWRLEATDGKVLGIVRGASSPSPNDLTAAAGLPAPEALSLEALLPAEHFRHAFRGVPKGRNVTRALGVQLARPQVVLLAGESITRCTPDEDLFPDVDLVLPRTPAPWSFRANPLVLIDVLRAAAEVSAARGEPPTVEILFWGAERPVGIITQGPGEVTLDALVMPLSDPKPTR